jgi:secreted trypsin-like serine protease
MTCNQKGSYGGHVTDNMFCAGKTGEDACQRDSGGPATFTVSTETRLVGVVSWGDKCGVPLKYGVYTRIAQFAAWVKDQTSGEVSW